MQESKPREAAMPAGDPPDPLDTIKRYRSKSLSRELVTQQELTDTPLPQGPSQQPPISHSQHMVRALNAPHPQAAKDQPRVCGQDPDLPGSSPLPPRSPWHTEEGFIHPSSQVEEGGGHA